MNVRIPLPEESASIEYDFHARSRSTISGKDPVARQYLNAIVGFFFRCFILWCQGQECTTPKVDVHLSDSNLNFAQKSLSFKTANCPFFF